MWIVKWGEILKIVPRCVRAVVFEMKKVLFRMRLAVKNKVSFVRIRRQLSKVHTIVEVLYEILVVGFPLFCA